MKTKSIFILVVFLLFACNKNEESTSKESNTPNKITIEKNKKEERVVHVQESLNNKKKIEKPSIDDCFELINLLVKKCDFNKKMISMTKSVGSNYYVIVDEATKEKITIKIVLDKDNQMPIAWLILDLEKMELYDTTNDELNPELINNVDKEIIQKFKDNCLIHCLD